MAVILDINANVPKDIIRDFVRACDGYREKLGNSQAVAVRRGTIAFVKSIRALTPKSKKQAPLSHVTSYTGDGPHYITPKSGKFKGKSLHRFNIKRRGGTDAFTAVRPAESRADARARHGQYKKWGLAKKSWGWFMHALFNRSNPETGNPNAKITSDMVECVPLREIATGPNKRVEVTLVNKLNYIRDIVPGSALAVAMRAATRSINTQIEEGHAKARKELT